MIDVQTLFERRQGFPNPNARQRLSRLVGLDDHIDKLTKVLGLLVNPKGLRKWGAEFHAGSERLLDSVVHRPPLIILAGDVGSGKTELAETIGDAVARQESIEVTLLPLSLSTRGHGKVGEITQLLSAAFDYTAREADKCRSEAKSHDAVILLIDEADTLAESRDAEMHHEARSGVNALIRGVDRLANERLPAAVIMCTNRYKALDPAVKRRAAEILVFERPNEEKRRQLLGASLGALGLAPADIEAVVAATGSRGDGQPGFAFSDLTQRLIPSIVLDAYPSRAIEPARAIAIAEKMQPTPVFGDS